MPVQYFPLLGAADGARRLHVHLTEIPDTSRHEHYRHAHEAEEAVYLLEGKAVYTFGGRTIEAGPGDLVFFPSRVLHADVRYLTPSMRYLVMRSVEAGDPPCCCGADRVA